MTWSIGSSVEGGAHDGFHLYDDRAGTTVAWVEPRPDVVDEETGGWSHSDIWRERRDVRLLVAAPELLEALRGLVESTPTDRPWARARALLDRLGA